MNGFSGTNPPPTGLYVRALYDYQADDMTSLSFRQGDVIQVITQLESGWWDGVINGVRGWFPSNYCAVVPAPAEEEEDPRAGSSTDFDDDHDTQSLGGGSNYASSDNGTESYLDTETPLPIERHEPREQQEEAAFWIPQATPDGCLFYFNTLTGVSTMELPLETPAPNENGPADRHRVFMPDGSRPPAELMASGLVEDTDDSDFEGTGMTGSYGSLVSRPCLHPLSLSFRH